MLVVAYWRSAGTRRAAPAFVEAPDDALWLIANNTGLDLAESASASLPIPLCSEVVKPTAIAFAQDGLHL